MYSPNTYQRPGGEGEPTVVPIEQEGSHFKDSHERIVVPSAHVGGTNVSIQFDVKTTDDTFTCAGDVGDNANRLALVLDGDTSNPVHANAGSPVVYVDDVEQTSPTRDSLHAAIATGSWVTVRIENFDSSSWSDVSILFLDFPAHTTVCEVRNVKVDANGDGTWDAETATGNDDGFEFIRCPE